MGGWDRGVMEGRREQGEGEGAGKLGAAAGHASRARRSLDDGLAMLRIGRIALLSLVWSLGGGGEGRPRKELAEGGMLRSSFAR